MSAALQPAEVVEEFIRAMNAWGLAAWQLHRAARDSADPASYQEQVLAMQHEVFAKYCTARERPRGRQGSFQRPPEYDPEREQVTQVDVTEDRAYVDTEREAILGGGAHRYVLHHKHGVWLIDSLKESVDGAWIPKVL